MASDAATGRPPISSDHTIRYLGKTLMSISDSPIGLEMDVSYPQFQVSLTLLSVKQMRFEVKEGPFARTETVNMHVIPLGNSLFAISWQEQDGATVASIQDYDRGLIHSHATLPKGQVLRMTGTFRVIRSADRMSDDRPQRNKVLVLEAMTSLFQRHDASAVERFYAPDYIKRNPDISQGRDALKALVADLSQTVYYEPGLMIAEGDLVAIQGRIRGWADKPLVAVDVFRIEGDKLAEDRYVLQNEVPVTAALGDISMFDPEEAARHAKLGSGRVRHPANANAVDGVRLGEKK